MRLSIFFVMLIIASVQLFAQVQDSDAEGWKQDGIEYEIGNVTFDYKLRENPGDTTLYKYLLEGAISFDFF